MITYILLIIKFSYIPKQATTCLSPKFFGVNYRSSTYQSRSATCILFHHSILSEVILSVNSLIDMSFGTTSNIIFWSSSTFLCSLNLNQLNLFHQSNNHSPPKMTKLSQQTLPRLLINKTSPIFKQISLFRILSFHVFLLIHLNIIISTTFIS